MGQSLGRVELRPQTAPSATGRTLFMTAGAGIARLRTLTRG